MKAINAWGQRADNSKIGAADSGQILLQMPGEENPERVKDLIGKASKLELVKVSGPPSPSPVQTFPTREAALQSIGGKDTDSLKVFPYFERDDSAAQNPQEPKQSKFVVVEYPAVVDGNELRDASAVPQAQNSTQYTISFASTLWCRNSANGRGEYNNYMGVV